MCWPFRLRIAEGAGPRRELHGQARRVTIGASPNADFIVYDEAASPLHCEVTPELPGLLLTDHASEHGTWLEGIRVREAWLPSAAKLRIGSTLVDLSVSTVPFPDLGTHTGTEEAAWQTALSRALNWNVPLMLTGEAGAGRNVAARAVHAIGPRANGPFVTLYCSPPPPRLVPREGAVPDAEERPTGIDVLRAALVMADGGTLFIDDVGHLDRAFQRMLLEALESREIRVGERSRPLPVELSVITSTRCDLDCVVASGAFRADLRRLLGKAKVRLRSLPDPATDLSGLVQRFADEYHVRLKGRLLSSEPPPSSSRASMLRRGNSTPAGFASELPPATEMPSIEPGESGTLALPFKVAKAHVVRRFEHEYLVATLKRHGGNITAAALDAGVDRVHFLRLLDRHGLRSSKQRPS